MKVITVNKARFEVKQPGDHVMEISDIINKLTAKDDIMSSPTLKLQID